jgi:predicted anti-sigma-YlaC factor YlaD
VTATNELVCRDAVELFSDYLDGRLSEEMIALCEQHLHNCSPCMAYLGQLKLTIQSLRGLLGEGLSAETKATLLAKFREFKGS